jgi:hypothetical protein
MTWKTVLLFAIGTTVLGVPLNILALHSPALAVSASWLCGGVSGIIFVHFLNKEGDENEHSH